MWVLQRGRRISYHAMMLGGHSGIPHTLPSLSLVLFHGSLLINDCFFMTLLLPNDLGWGGMGTWVASKARASIRD